MFVSVLHVTHNTYDHALLCCVLIITSTKTTTITNTSFVAFGHFVLCTIM